MRRARATPTIAGAMLLVGVACSRPSTKPSATQSTSAVDPIAHLRTFEEGKRASTKFVETRPQDQKLGPDPYDVAVLPNGSVAGVLRGADAVVLLDSALKEAARAPTPRSPTAIAVCGDSIVVASELEPRLARYDLQLHRTTDIELGEGVLGVRDVACRGNNLAIVEEHDHRLITISAKGVRKERPMPHSPIRVAQTKNATVVMSLLDHTLSVLRGDVTHTASIDGPFWGFDAIDDGEDVVIVAGGAEDKPLDRRGGFFGNVDSFVYAYRETTEGVARIATLNVGEQGLILPKAIAFSSPREVLVTSYGSDRALLWRDGATVQAIPSVPGISAIVKADGGFVGADPLIDAWIRIDASSHVVRVPAEDGRTDREKLGEALFFTSLMAPTASSEGPKSRFTCETCHFEGYVDGRTHHTGRGEVHAVTKPLVGLFNNRPHFSRALDPDLSSIAENEFRVAGAPSPADPHFDLDAKDVEWLGIEKKKYDAAELRIALMSFLMSFSHRTNPRTVSRGGFTAEERKGAETFRDRCEGCHQARSAADDAASRTPFDRWEGLIFNGGPLVWASDAYERTGIEPYVHEKGARVPSLRRVFKKRPYFTNGSAASIEDVIKRTKAGSHSSSSDLDAETQRAVAAFVDLL